MAAGDVGWYWHLVEAELEASGHHSVAPYLPISDDAAGLDTYADVVVEHCCGGTSASGASAIRVAMRAARGLTGCRHQPLPPRV